MYVDLERQDVQVRKTGKAGRDAALEPGQARGRAKWAKNPLHQNAAVVREKTPKTRNPFLQKPSRANSLILRAVRAQCRENEPKTSKCFGLSDLGPDFGPIVAKIRMQNTRPEMTFNVPTILYNQNCTPYYLLTWRFMPFQRPSVERHDAHRGAMLKDTKSGVLRKEDGLRTGEKPDEKRLAPSRWARRRTERLGTAVIDRRYSSGDGKRSPLSLTPPGRSIRLSERGMA